MTTTKPIVNEEKLSKSLSKRPAPNNDESNKRRRLDNQSSLQAEIDECAKLTVENDRVRQILRDGWKEVMMLDSHRIFAEKVLYITCLNLI